MLYAKVIFTGNAFTVLDDQFQFRHLTQTPIIAISVFTTIYLFNLLMMLILQLFAENPCGIIVQRFNCLDGYLSDWDDMFENNINPIRDGLLRGIR